MADDSALLTQREYRIARRLTRLFRVERNGRAEHWGEVASRMRERRARLIDEMLRLEERRRAMEPLVPAELAHAMTALAEEVGCSEQRCLERLAEFDRELRGRRGVPSGLRDGGGRLLGHG
ncbi:MAG TPA: hypothetical protein VG651_21060 [Stellaceae bacterium]|nr:hypothetical protein [Stellaceae bacterium]